MGKRGPKKKTAEPPPLQTPQGVAGKMHGDLQKSAKDSTLEHSLFAAFNTD